MTRALVLGGGGPIGVGWESGLIAGLEAGGVAVSQADFIIGTSAGSIVGAQLARGRDPMELYQAALERVERPDSPTGRPLDMAPLLAQFMKLYTSDASLDELRREMGEFALQANTAPEDEWLAGFTSQELLRDGHWPERRYVCTAIDTADGRLVAWDKDSGVPLPYAVASSCAVPGLFSPVTIKGRRYMDGGIGSTTNAAFAKGYDKVLVVAVVRPGGRAAATMPAIAERMRKRFEDELEEVRASGSKVELITPDEEFAQRFGVNLMDFSGRAGAAEMGFEQGKAEAARIAGFWNS
jgi:NTE family protein